METSKHIGKFILFVEPAEGQLSAVAPPLKELGFSVLRATTIKAAGELVATTPLLSMVAIDDAVGRDDGARLLAQVKRDHNELPVLWVTSQVAATPLSHTQYTPDAILGVPFDDEELRKVVERLLMSHLYPQAIVDALSAATVSVMAEACQTIATVSGKNVRANRNALGTVNAILPFCGRHISGRLVIGAEEDALLDIHRRIVGEGPATRLEAEDLAGEMANLIVGRVKSFFSSHDLDFELGTPIILVGRQISVRYRASRPALVLTLEEKSKPCVRVSFSFDTYEVERFSALSDNVDAEAVEAMTGGELMFL